MGNACFTNFQYMEQHEIRTTFEIQPKPQSASLFRIESPLLSDNYEPDQEPDPKNEVVYMKFLTATNTNELNVSQDSILKSILKKEKTNFAKKNRKFSEDKKVQFIKS
ncbi:hypothetical protein pb186bvf_017664 [Paramecium bursaria]